MGGVLELTGRTLLQQTSRVANSPPQLPLLFRSSSVSGSLGLHAPDCSPSFSLNNPFADGIPSRYCFLVDDFLQHK